MPIEIREITIKTQIVSGGTNSPEYLKEKDFRVFKKRILEECRILISNGAKRKSYKR